MLQQVMSKHGFVQQPVVLGQTSPGEFLKSTFWSGFLLLGGIAIGYALGVDRTILRLGK